MLLFIYAITHRDTLLVTDVCRLADTLTNSERIQLGITESVIYWQIDGGLDDLCRAIEPDDAPDRVTGERRVSTLDCRASMRHRTATEQHPEEMYYERMIHLTVDVPEMGGLPRPALARSANIVKASGGGEDSNTSVGVVCFDTHEKVIGTIAHVIGDRSYTQALAENWVLLLWIRGIRQTIDLRDDQRVVVAGPVKDTI